uniref:Metallo-beta-lactamase domain-containing protein n=1 Tax=uncultured prokaryote TaxID=198431 RepID=A0A0H5QGY2_9ZZZZ|nr:hypothetical protein [uncultured prokaryote]
MLRFISLSSGSCGNCYFIHDGGKGLLIDAGVSMRRVKRTLADHGYGLDAFSAVLVTHDHLDHIRHLGSICKKLVTPVYATSVLHGALARHTFTKDWIGPCRKDLLDDGPTEIMPGVSVRYFVVPHDATLGRLNSSKQDYETAQKKVAEYRATAAKDSTSFADTTKKYSALLALDADFAKKDFDDELLQNRDINIRLKPLYRFGITASRNAGNYALEHRYENALVGKFISDSPLPLAITNADTLGAPHLERNLDSELYGDSAFAAGDTKSLTDADRAFIKGLYEVQSKQYAKALERYDEALGMPAEGRYSAYYRAFYHMNRGTLRAEMIDFISSIENNVQTLTMDDQGTTRARVRDQVSQTYDYSEAIEDMEEAGRIIPGLPYVYFNLGNLYCLSSRYVESVDNFTKAIQYYPYMGDAYYNRGLVLIFLKDKEKGCIDLSRAGELGVSDAYGVISKYCEEEK